jgi:hypothetical protein
VRLGIGAGISSANIMFLKMGYVRRNKLAFWPKP